MTPEDIKQLRDDLGRTKEGFAKVLCTTATTVYRWETGRHPPSPYFVAKMKLLRKWQLRRAEEERNEL